MAAEGRIIGDFINIYVRIKPQTLKKVPKFSFRDAMDLCNAGFCTGFP